MGDLILGPVVQTIVSKLISAAAEQIRSAADLKQELTTLQDILRTIQALLKDAEERQVRDPAVKLWLEKLRDVAREADDVLDEVAYESVKRKLLIQNQMKKKVCYFFTLSNPIAFRIRMASKIQTIIASVSDINNKAQQFGLQSRLAGGAASECRRNPQTHSLVGDVSQIVGRDDDVSKMVHLLTDSTNELPLCVLSIVGMPGLGKTTLAQCVRDDVQVQKHFGRIMWVCVSENFDVERIVAEMLESLTKSSCDIRNKDTVVQKIRDQLEENRFLLVLDDVWNGEKWKDLESCLLGICKKSGNRIIVTTRSEGVALTMGTRAEHMHRLEQLKDEECWSIIKRRVFRDDPAPLELVEIGRNIAKKCGGVPLVASVIGGTLCIRRPDRVEWLSIESKIDALGPLEQNNGIMPVIQLSFDRLPNAALKQCFAFCSIFPKDFVMEREMLIQLWMAEGFLQSPEESPLTMEDIGDEFFNDLLSYSLFQADEKDRLHGSVASCRMHDLIHDFVQSISKSDTVILDNLSTRDISKVRHLNFSCDLKMMPATIGDVGQLHTLFSKHDFSSGVSGNFRRLRVLSFRDAVDIEEFPPRFSNMKSLSYLDISGTRIPKLPKFISELYSLQTFRFIRCRSLKMPPNGIGNLINLRHILFSDKEHTPANIGRLTSLQTLPLFSVGATKGRKIEELGNLRGLKGRLEISNLELVKDRSEAMGAKLDEKKISELELIWGTESNWDEDVLEGLLPPSDLQVLEIDGYGGKNLPSWMLKNLLKLKIKLCKKLESIPVMTGFSSLQMLTIFGCLELSTIADGAFATLASLKELEIDSCAKLESVPLNGLSLLERLQIWNCEELNSIGDSLSTSTCLKKFSLWHCRNLRFIPSLFGLASLQQLAFYHCGLERLPSGLSSCIALEELDISNCHSLISIPEELKEIHSLVNFVIRRCSKLRNIPENTLNSLTRLKKLCIGGFSEELEGFPCLSSIHSLQASLEELELTGWGKLTELPHQIQNLNPTALKWLSIRDFNKVETLPNWLGNFSSLKSLWISDCLRLKCLPSGLSFFTSLERLTVIGCPNLVSTDLEEIVSGLACLKTLLIGPFSQELEEFPGLSSIHHLSTSLQFLWLNGWEKLTQLPHQIQHLLALRDLYIQDFDGVEALPEWLGNLSSLQRLSIWGCKNLKHLPSAEAIRCLSKLKFLEISGCPELEIRYAKESGPEWYKISHIPSIRINGKDI